MQTLKSKFMRLSWSLYSVKMLASSNVNIGVIGNNCLKPETVD